MSIFVDDAKVVVQGATGHQGQLQIKAMQNFGTDIIAGVTPEKGGMQIHEIPVFNQVAEAVDIGANTSLILVPAPFAKDAAIEALDAGIQTLIITTAHIPVHDAMDFFHYALYKSVRLIGPNSPGIASPGKTKIGILPNNIFREGPVGIVSRSCSLTYEIVNELSENNIGQTTCICLGSDPIIGTNFIDALKAFEMDNETRAIVLIGELGGTAEEHAASYIMKHVEKPVYAYIAGRTAPVGKRMEYGSVMTPWSMGTARSKIDAFKQAQVKIAQFPNDIPELIKQDGIL